MPINQTQKYAIKIIHYLALHKDLIISASKLNTELDIPYKYLTHILTKLAKAKLIKNYRGKVGGFSFQRDAKEVFLLEIINTVSEINFSQCILNSTTCNCNNPCFLHTKWEGVREEIKDFLEKTSLFDLSHTNPILN